MGSLGPLARSLDDIELALSVLAPDAAAAARGRACGRLRGRRPAAGQRARAAKRSGRPPPRSTLYEARPPRQAEARRLFDAIAGEEIGGLPAFVGDRDAELAPYNRGAVAFARTFEPSLERYLTAFDDLAALEDDAAAWFEHHPVILCPVAPDVAPPVGVVDWPPVDGEPIRARREALALHLRERARAAGAGGPGHARPVSRSACS